MAVTHPGCSHARNLLPWLTGPSTDRLLGRAVEIGGSGSAQFEMETEPRNPRFSHWVSCGHVPMRSSGNIKLKEG